MNKKSNHLAEVFVLKEVMLMLQNLALLTEREEVAALMIGNKTVSENKTSVFVKALSIPPRGEIKKDRVEIMSEDLVNAMEDAKDLSIVKGENLNVIGWYHSHPHITVWPSNVDLQTQLNLQNMDSCFLGLICSSYNTDTTGMVREMRVICFQSKQVEGLVTRIDVPFHVVSTPCTSQIAFGEIVKHIGTLYDELENKFNRANENESCPVAQLHNESAYAVLGLHMLETVAKPMLQMFETQRESSKKRVQQLQAKLDLLLAGGSDELACEGYDIPGDDLQNRVILSNEILPTLNSGVSGPKKEKKSGMVSSPV